MLQPKHRLDKDENYGIMKEQLKAGGVVEEVNGNGTLGTITYLPHGEVV